MRIPTMDTKLRRAECGWLGDHASRLEEMYSGSHFYPVMAKKLEPFFFLYFFFAITQKKICYKNPDLKFFKYIAFFVHKCTIFSHFSWLNLNFEVGGQYVWIWFYLFFWGGVSMFLGAAEAPFLLKLMVGA